MSPRKTPPTRSIPSTPRGAGERSREDELLADFESWKQGGKQFSITEFCEHHGYASVKGIRRFSRLRAALHAYCRTGTRHHVQLPDAIAALRRDLAAREAEVARLRERLAVVVELEAQLREAKVELEQATAQSNQLRAMVTALVFQIAPQSVKRAEQIERLLLAVARPLVPGLPDTVPEGTAVTDSRALKFVRDDA